MLIDSTIVLISSLLLVIAGSFVLLMRRSFRQALSRRSELYRAALEPDVDGYIEKRSGLDRRQRTDSRWPVVDATGTAIASDRRIAERRLSVT